MSRWRGSHHAIAYSIRCLCCPKVWDAIVLVIAKKKTRHIREMMCKSSGHGCHMCLQEGSRDNNYTHVLAVSRT